MKAKGNNVVIEPLEVKSDKTKCGLLLVKKDREDISYNKAVIRSISNEVKALNEGDEIYYDRHAGYTIEFDKEHYPVIKIQDIVVVL